MKEQIAEWALADKCLATNPRRTEKSDVLRILQEIW